MENLGIVILFFTIVYIFEKLKKKRISKFLNDYQINNYEKTQDNSDWRLQQFYDANLQKGKYNK